MDKCKYCGWITCEVEENGKKIRVCMKCWKKQEDFIDFLNSLIDGKK